MLIGYYQKSKESFEKRLVKGTALDYYIEITPIGFFHR